MFEQARSHDYFSVGGASYANGFDLEFSTILGHSETLAFRVWDTEEEQERRYDWPVVLLFLAFYFAAWSNWLVWPKVFIMFLLWRTAGQLIERSYKSWHWVEHQSALWLEGNLEDRFDDISPISTRCGSTYLIAQSLALASVFMVLEHGVFFFAVFASAYATMQLHQFSKRKKPFSPMMRSALVVIAWPAAVVCLAFQRMFYMRKPTEAQRAHAKQWAIITAPIIARSLISDDPKPRIVKVTSPRHR